MSQENRFPTKRLVYGIIGALILFGVFFSTCNVFVMVDANEIVVIKYPNGTMKVETDPGPAWTFFGTATPYQRSAQFWFSAQPDQGESRDQAIEARFNDGGKGWISGSLRVDLPLDHDKILELHRKYHGMDNLMHELVRTSVERSVYMTGQLMSSKESATERRADILHFIEDQLLDGVYKTIKKDVRVLDETSQKEKTVAKTELVLKDGAPSGIDRQEVSPLRQFGFSIYNVAIENIKYEDAVEKQIADQQRMLMQVQTAMAKSKEAEQQAMTAEKEGQAAAAKAKWEQEALKATAVTAAEQARDVAKLAVETAEQRKKEQTLLGEGEGARARAMMAANGALELKLAAWKEVMLAMAPQIGRQRWVPEIVVGSSTGNNSVASGLDIMQMLGIKAARELALDMSMASQQQAVAAAQPQPQPAGR